MAWKRRTLLTSYLVHMRHTFSVVAVGKGSLVIFHYKHAPKLEVCFYAGNIFLGGGGVIPKARGQPANTPLD